MAVVAEELAATTHQPFLDWLVKVHRPTTKLSKSELSGLVDQYLQLDLYGEQRALEQRESEQCMSNVALASSAALGPVRIERGSNNYTD